MGIPSAPKSGEEKWNGIRSEQLLPMDLLFKVQKSGHNEMMRAKEQSLRYPEQCLQQNSSPLHPMLKWKDVIARSASMKNMLGGAPSSTNTGAMMPLWTECGLCRSVQDESRL